MAKKSSSVSVTDSATQNTKPTLESLIAEGTANRNKLDTKDSLVVRFAIGETIATIYQLYAKDWKTAAEKMGIIESEAYKHRRLFMHKEVILKAIAEKQAEATAAGVAYFYPGLLGALALIPPTEKPAGSVDKEKKINLNKLADRRKALMAELETINAVLIDKGLLNAA